MSIIRLKEWPRGKTWSASGEKGLTFVFMMYEIGRYAYEIVHGALGQEATDEIANMVAAWIHVIRMRDPGAYLDPAAWHRGVIGKIKKLMRRRDKEDERNSGDDPDKIVPDGQFSIARPSTDPLMMLIDKEIAERVWGLFPLMTKLQQQVIYLRYWQGMSFNQIGAILDTSEGNAGGTHLKALKRLRRNVTELRRELAT